MVRLLVETIPALHSHPYDGSKMYIEATGLSTDTKPTTGILNGSTFLEIDTSKVYFFNEATSTWIEAGGTNA